MAGFLSDQMWRIQLGSGADNLDATAPNSVKLPAQRVRQPIRHRIGVEDNTPDI
jgi:hypothetical protein